MRFRGRLTGAIACIALGAGAGSALAVVPSWTSYHHDAGRSGVDPDSSSPVAPTQAWQTSPALDGAIYSEPLVYGSTVYDATENDTVYALSASTGAILWEKHLATPVPSSSLPCGNISPAVGITSTPVIDPATGRIYVVADTWDGTNAKHQLFGLNLGDGSPAPGMPVVVDPPGSTPTAQLQRAGLALDAGKVIVGFGGNDGDCGSYHGWLVAVPEGGGSLQTFEVDPSTSQGAIWASGNAPAIDSAGDIWTSTGNGSSSTFGNQESVIKLDSNLNVLDHWAPSNWSSLDSGDTDLGSSMPLLLPGGLVFQIGKQGVGYLLSATSLGGTGAPAVYQASVCNGSWGGGIYVSGVIYVTCSGGLRALALNTSARTFAPLASWAVNSNATGPPIYAGGLVWSAGTGNGVLYGLDAGTGATRFSSSLGGFEHFATPSAGGGRLFVANRNQVTAFQIATAPQAAATTTSVASSRNPSPAGSAVTFTAGVIPAPDGGTVAFTDNGRAISACAAVSVASGRAACRTTYRAAARHAILASYSGDSSFGGSSGGLTQVVRATAPVISHLKASAVRRKLRLSLKLSKAARLTVTIARALPGRVVHRRCLAGASRGGRCRALVRMATLTFAARKASATYRPRMRALAPGRYTVTVTAASADGGRSRRYSASLVVTSR